MADAKDHARRVPRDHHAAQRKAPFEAGGLLDREGHRDHHHQRAADHHQRETPAVVAEQPAVLHGGDRGRNEEQQHVGEQPVGAGLDPARRDTTAKQQREQYDQPTTPPGTGKCSMRTAKSATTQRPASAALCTAIARRASRR